MFFDKNPGIARKVRYIDVTESGVGQRLDNYLLRLWKDVPKSHVYRLIREGQVRVNGSRSKVFQKLSAGDRIRLPPIRTSARTQKAIPNHLKILQDCTLYEDKSILIIDKPSGIAVHGGTRIAGGVIEALREYRKLDTYLELVHRLDRETSGCLILAKNPVALRFLHSALRGDSSNRISKRYLSLLVGHWTYGKREVKLRLSTTRKAGDLQRSTVAKTGREATTLITPIKVFNNHVLVEIDLKTGRMHQIRAHAKGIGHPVAGDQKYGSHLANRDLKKLGLNRLFLHATEVELTHPESGRKLRVKAPIPDNLKVVMEKLQ